MERQLKNIVVIFFLAAIMASLIISCASQPGKKADLIVFIMPWQEIPYFKAEADAGIPSLPRL